MLFDNRDFKNSQENPGTGQQKSSESNKKEPAERTGGGASGSNPPEDFIRMKEWIRGIQSDTERARTLAEQNRTDQRELQSQVESLSRRTSRGNWAGLLLLACLAGAGVYGYSRIQDQVHPFEQIPALREMVDAASQRLGAAESTLQDWSGRWAGLNDRVDRAVRTTAANLRISKDFATERAAAVQRELQAELENRSNAMESSVSGLRASQEQDRAEVSGLKNELSAWKLETDGQLAQVRDGQSRGEARLSALSTQVAGNHSELASVQRVVDRQRIDFELRKEQTLEVVPGVTLTVSKTDVAYQRIEGRIHVIEDGRILWVRSLGIQQPATFYIHADERPYQIVVTRVARDSAIGYVLTPVQHG